jgi:hypothetical protein
MQEWIAPLFGAVSNAAERGDDLLDHPVSEIFDLDALADHHARTALRGLLTPAIGGADGWRTK